MESNVFWERCSLWASVLLSFWRWCLENGFKQRVYNWSLTMVSTSCLKPRPWIQTTCRDHRRRPVVGTFFETILETSFQKLSKIDAYKLQRKESRKLSESQEIDALQKRAVLELNASLWEVSKTYKNHNTEIMQHFYWWTWNVAFSTFPKTLLFIDFPMCLQKK